MEVTDLPAVNATLNGISTAFLMTGFFLIKNGKETLHKRCMLGALTTSALFLVCYVIYHWQTGSKPFQGEGVARYVYFAILIPHVTLAITVLPLALVTAARGLRSQFDRHVQIARWTFPIWLYVSVTGVIVYVMLYRIY